ncbi:MAG: hypothetical protein EOO50_07505 [Flavobacterium sp.]|uniref:hypothetical protein n=1 Tax=Flavobacterium sp. TaxID=239 RepID=UPI00120B71CB|nr:hypothetical protein [Flavobacterium sp.]RZJ67100.1 MAG: hypothetical protein EOO50_07505 [Flavobacterium sp.]
MKFLPIFILTATVLLAQKESALTTESYKLVNDLNTAENRSAIYMCREVNNMWTDYFMPKSIKDEFPQKKADTIAKYIGGNIAIWKKNIPIVESWEPRVKATEYVNYHGLNIDEFSRTHNRNGVFLYSTPLFNAERTKALIYIWYLSSKNVVLDNYYYCEKENGKWKKKNVVLIGGF